MFFHFSLNFLLIFFLIWYNYSYSSCLLYRFPVERSIFFCFCKAQPGWVRATWGFTVGWNSECNQVKGLQLPENPCLAQQWPMGLLRPEGTCQHSQNHVRQNCFACQALPLLPVLPCVQGHLFRIPGCDFGGPLWPGPVNLAKGCPQSSLLWDPPSSVWWLASGSALESYSFTFQCVFIPFDVACFWKTAYGWPVCHIGF